MKTRLPLNNKGSITIFQCIIFMSVLMVAGIIIDFARITAAEKKVQGALNSALRSQMASCDRDLAGDYGIFAADANSAGGEGEEGFQAGFKEYLKRNLEENSKYKLIKYEVNMEKSIAEGRGGLLSQEPDYLREQILEYMKYRGPMAIAGNVIGKFDSSGIFEKAQYSKKEKEARANSKALKEQVEYINGSIGKASESMRNAERMEGLKYLEEIKRLSSSIEKALEAAGKIEDLYSKYDESSKEAEKLAEEANKKEALNQEGASIKTGGSEFSNVLEEGKKTLRDLRENQALAKELINSIEPLQNEIEGLEEDIDRLEDSVKKLKQRIKNIEERGQDADTGGLLEDIQECNNQIGEKKSEIKILKKKINEIREQKGFVTMTGINLEEFRSNSGEDIIEKPDFSQYDDLKEQLSQYLEKTIIQEHWLITEEEFKTAGRAEADSKLGFPEESIREKEVLKKKEDLEAAEDENAGLLSFLEGIYEEVVLYFKNGTEASIEKMYITEYIMDKFTFHTSKTERNHFFEKGEVEYILWGDRDQKANIDKTMVSLGLIRLAINTVDYFATSEILDPSLRLIYAVGRGLVQSAADTYNLYKGEEVSISPSLKGKKISFGLNYSDYLRLFLMLQSVRNEEEQLNNIRQLMQVNIKQTGREEFRIGNFSTGLYGSAEVRINLMFIPLLKLDRLKPGLFQENKYIIRKKAYMAY